MESSPIDSEPQQYQDSNPWDNGTAPVDHTPRQQAAPQVRVQPPVSIQPEVERKTSPLGNIYQPDPYPAPGYGTYNPGLIARPYAGSGRGVGGPWNNNRGSGFQGPWNNNGSSFSPWGGRNGSGNGISPFGMSSPGGWFE